ncbi:methyl-accepting chemotaxis protein [Rhizobium sp. LEGMi198b]
MKLFLKWFSGLKFRFKVAGGFLVILILAAIVGSVGYSAIVDLSSRFSIVGRSAEVTNEMQSTSLQRERYLFDPGIESASATRQRIKDLNAALETLSEAVKNDPLVTAKVAEVKATVDEFASTFDRVIAQTDQQQQRLATLQRSISDLEALAASINDAVGKEESRIRVAADAANKELSAANGLLGSAVKLQQGANSIKSIQQESGGAFLGDFLQQAKTVAESIVAETEKLNGQQIDGLDPAVLPKLAQAGKLLEQSLDDIGSTEDFKRKFDAQTIVGKTVNEILALTQSIQAQTFPLVDAAMNKASASSAELSKFRELAVQAETLGRLALAARAEMLNLFGGFGDTDPAPVEGQLKGLVALEKTIATAATALPSIADDVKQIPVSITIFDKAFREMLVAQADLAREREQLAKLTTEVSLKIDTLNAEQINTAHTAAGSATFKIGVTVLLAIAGGICLAVLLNFAISRPIQSMTDVIRKLASGENDVLIPGINRGDEIGIMAKAVQVLRATAIEKLSLEDRAEQNRRESEIERNNREREKLLEATKLQKAVNALAAGLRRLASGDISIDIDEKFSDELDRLRTDFNSEQAHLRVALSDVERSATSIRSNTRELDLAVNDLSRRTEKQATSLEETAAALEEITATVSASADRANEAGQIAAKTSDATSHAQDVVRNAVSAMAKIEQSSEKIRQIISVMDDIAFQTNLLALNAGVEAARAGEAGNGFAVVAQEVRELAARSATAAKEITSLINTSNADVTAGVSLVTESGGTLQEIDRYVNDMHQRVKAIASSSQEQFASISSVNSAVRSMDHMTQQNAAMVEEASASTAALSGEAERLHDQFARFELGGTEKRNLEDGVTAA